MLGVILELLLVNPVPRITFAPEARKAGLGMAKPLTKTLLAEPEAAVYYE